MMNYMKEQNSLLETLRHDFNQCTRWVEAPLQNVPNPPYRTIKHLVLSREDSQINRRVKNIDLLFVFIKHNF